VATDRQSLHAFYATLAAICYLVTIGAVLAALGRDSEALGVSAAVTDLIDRRSLCPIRYGHMGMSQHEVVVDRILSVRERRF
jgi:hypothetical protein